MNYNKYFINYHKYNINYHKYFTYYHKYFIYYSSYNINYTINFIHYHKYFITYKHNIYPLYSSKQTKYSTFYHNLCIAIKTLQKRAQKRGHKLSKNRPLFVQKSINWGPRGRSKSGKTVQKRPKTAKKGPFWPKIGYKSQKAKQNDQKRRAPCTMFLGEFHFSWVGGRGPLFNCPITEGFFLPFWTLFRAFFGPPPQNRDFSLFEPFSDPFWTLFLTLFDPYFCIRFLPYFSIYSPILINLLIKVINMLYKSFKHA